MTATTGDSTLLNTFWIIEMYRYLRAIESTASIPAGQLPIAADPGIHDNTAVRDISHGRSGSNGRPRGKEESHEEGNEGDTRASDDAP